MALLLWSLLLMLKQSRRRPLKSEKELSFGLSRIQVRQSMTRCLPDVDVAAAPPLSQGFGGEGEAIPAVVERKRLSHLLRSVVLSFAW